MMHIYIGFKSLWIIQKYQCNHNPTKLSVQSQPHKNNITDFLGVGEISGIPNFWKLLIDHYYA